MSDAEVQSEPRTSPSEMDRDSELMFGSPENSEPPSQDPIYYKNAASFNEVPTDDQNEETSSADVTGEKIVPNVPMTDGTKEKVVLLTNGQQNKENGVHFAAIIILPKPSKL